MHDLLSLTPAGHLVMLRRMISEAAPAAGTGVVRNETLAEGFSVSQAEGLIALAGGRPDPTWPLSWSFWRDFAARYLTALCQMPPASRLIDAIAPPNDAELSRISLSIPPMPGAEYCCAETPRDLEGPPQLVLREDRTAL